MIDEEGTNLGIVDSRFAMNKAKNADLDLIVVNKTATPPVCRIGNYGKMKYVANKKQRENKKREHKNTRAHLHTKCVCVCVRARVRVCFCALCGIGFPKP